VRDAVRANDGAQRIKAIKAATYSLPGRDLLRFMQSYALRLGMLDGMPGLHYCLMISMYEYWIALKLRELRRPWGAETEAVVERLCREKRPVAAQLRPADSPMVEVVIATYNERDQIADAVRNALQLGSVFVVDSFSTDGTPDLARDAGATVIQHPFANYARQKNWAIDNLPLQAPWIFILDADERITPQLRDEVLRKIRTQPHIDGYYVNRLLIFMGCPVRHGGLYPSWNLRLFRRGCARYEDRVVHEHMVCKGRTAYLRGEMLHIRRETISHYIFKHIGYADLESGEWVKWRSGESRVAAASDLFKGHLRYRQWARRHLWHRLPGRPLWRLFFMYIVRLGFLDGAAGWHLARLMACYEYMIGLLFAEKRRGRDHLVEAAPAATTVPVTVSAGANEPHAPPAEART